MDDIIGYERKDPRVRGSMRSGYPRFFEHVFLSELRSHWTAARVLPPGNTFLTAEPSVIEPLIAYVGCAPSAAGERDGLGWVVFPAGNESACQRAGAYLQHTGAAPSSRQAEDLLVTGGWRESIALERTLPSNESALVARLAPTFGVPESHLLLARGGMNAFHAAYTTISRLMQPSGRRRWVQLGWLYVDTIKVLGTMHAAGGEPIVWNDVFNLKDLARLLRTRRNEIAGIITEAPTNPLIQTPDLVALRALADELDCPLVLDPSVASVANVDVGRWADVVVSSLTKYSARSGDVLLGAAAINPHRKWARELRQGIARNRLPPYRRDLDRLGAELEGWEDFAAAASASCEIVAQFLQSHPKVERVWWAGQIHARDGYRRVARDDRPRWGAVLSFTLKGSLAGFYDAAEIAKGPSFGTRFSLMSPFIYLAHFDLISSPEGRNRLAEADLHPELIRLSVGEEPVGELVARLDAALARS